MNCAYCGEEWRERRGCCSHCGAPNKAAKISKGGPYFEGGFVYYIVQEMWRGSWDFIFYKGVSFCGKVTVSEYEMSAWNPALDYMPVIMSRLLGEAE